MGPLSAIRNQTIGCYSLMTGLFSAAHRLVV